MAMIELEINSDSLDSLNLKLAAAIELAEKLEKLLQTVSIGKIGYDSSQDFSSAVAAAVAEEIDKRFDRPLYFLSARK